MVDLQSGRKSGGFYARVEVAWVSGAGVFAGSGFIDEIFYTGIGNGVVSILKC